MTSKYLNKIGSTREYLCELEIGSTQNEIGPFSCSFFLSCSLTPPKEASTQAVWGFQPLSCRLSSFARKSSQVGKNSITSLLFYYIILSDNALAGQAAIGQSPISFSPRRMESFFNTDSSSFHFISPAVQMGRILTLSKSKLCFLCFKQLELVYCAVPKKSVLCDRVSLSLWFE